MKMLLTTSLLILFLPVVALAATIHVPSDQPTIQAGIDASQSGDTVIVAPWVYTERINFRGREITLKSEAGAEHTFLWGHSSSPGSLVTFDHDEGPDCVLDGFTLLGYNTEKTGSRAYYFPGISCLGTSSPTIKHCVFAHFYAEQGSGVNSEYGDLTFMNCKFTDNMAASYGAGVYITSGDVNFIDCEFTGNEIDWGMWGDGGGIYNDAGNLVLTRCVFDDNSAGWYSGGGLYNETGTVICNDCVFTRNYADDFSPDYGGGVFSAGGAVEINQCSFLYNYAGGGAGVGCMEGTMSITGCSFFGNAGGAVFCGMSGVVTMVNCVCWHNPYFGDAEMWLDYDGVLNISYSLLEGGQDGVFMDPEATLNWGDGMIDADPLYVDPEGWDLHITYDSPCRDAGDSAAPGIGDHDFEGDPRIHESAVDMGVDEFHTHLYCTGDFRPGKDIEGKFTGLPHTAPVGLFIGSGLLDPPLNHMWGKFCLEAPWMLLILVPIPSNGILILPELLPATPAAPYNIYMQALIGFELSNPFVLEVR